VRWAGAAAWLRSWRSWLEGEKGRPQAERERERERQKREDVLFVENRGEKEEESA
jgi:hypothetical protein